MKEAEPPSIKKIEQRVRRVEEIRLLSGGKEETKKERLERQTDRLFGLGGTKGKDIEARIKEGDIFLVEPQNINSSFARSEILAAPEEIDLLLQKADAVKKWLIDEGHGTHMSQFSTPIVDFSYLYSYITPKDKENQITADTRH